MASTSRLSVLLTIMLMLIVIGVLRSATEEIGTVIVFIPTLLETTAYASATVQRIVLTRGICAV